MTEHLVMLMVQSGPRGRAQGPGQHSVVLYWRVKGCWYSVYSGSMWPHWGHSAAAGTQPNPALYISVCLSLRLSLSVCLQKEKDITHYTFSLVSLSPSLHKSQYIGLNVHTINYNPIVLYDHHSHIQIYVHYIKLSPASEWPWLWMEHRLIVNSFIDLILELESIHCASLKTPKG